MTRDSISYHVLQALRRIRVATFYLESGMIDEAKKEALKSWRQIMSSLLIMNLYKEELKLSSYNVPRSKIFSVSKSLEDKGYNDLVEISAIYFSLLQDIPQSEIKILIIKLIEDEMNHIREWFKSTWNQKLESEFIDTTSSLKNVL
ncbi:hypothetical protein V6M85_10100 [Sulfolobus tengchongensis]|uniref:Uncharacterized protein n=1 Tax=Sulfolobus tengchongensis TaxID=207809 RepID=A0AAX4L0S9_9CREN